MAQIIALTQHFLEGTQVSFDGVNSLGFFSQLEQGSGVPLGKIGKTRAARGHSEPRSVSG